MKKTFFSLILIFLFFLTANALSCTTDDDCESMNYSVDEVKCLYRVHYFNPLKTDPDFEFDQYEYLKPEQWPRFIENGIRAGFQLGKPYSWRQQTRYIVTHKCIDGQCVKWKEDPKGKVCLWGCDISTGRCMCEVKSTSGPFCDPSRGPDIYATWQTAYRNENDECIQETSLTYACPRGYECGQENGSSKCIRKYYSNNPSASSYSTYIARRNNTGKGLTTAQFIATYGYSPIAEASSVYASKPINSPSRTILSTTRTPTGWSARYSSSTPRYSYKPSYSYTPYSKTYYRSTYSYTPRTTLSRTTTKKTYSYKTPKTSNTHYTCKPTNTYTKTTSYTYTPRANYTSRTFTRNTYTPTTNNTKYTYTPKTYTYTPRTTNTKTYSYKPRTINSYTYKPTTTSTSRVAYSRYYKRTLT